MSLRIVIKADGLCEGKGVFFGTVEFETWDEFAARLDEPGLVEFAGKLYRNVRTSNAPESP